MSADPTPVTVAVTPTLLTVAVFDVRNIGTLSLQVQNLDASQTMTGFIQKKVATAMGYATSSLPDFTAIQPVGSVDADGNPTDCAGADIDCAGLSDVALAMKSSGVGGDVRYVARKSGPKR